MFPDLTKYSKLDEGISQNRANMLISVGWELLAIVPYECQDWDVPKGAMYILGWNSKLGMPRYEI